MTGPLTQAALRRSPVARYVQLATLFRNRIGSGAWKVAERIPTLDQLVAECGVARATVRQALGELEKEGLIARQRSKGTTVLRRPPHGQWCTVQMDWQGMLRPRDGAQVELLAREDGVAFHGAEPPIGQAAGSYTRLRRRHWYDGQAYLLTNVYVASPLIPLIPPARLTNGTALSMVAEIPGITLADAHQVFTAGSADMAEADLLGLPLNAAVMKQERYGTGADGLLLVASFGVYRAEVVRLDIGLKRG